VVSGWLDDVTAFDIEATGLDANKARLISVGWKRKGEKRIHTISQLDVQETFPGPKGPMIDAADDTKLALAFREVLDKPSILTSWFGTGYDKKFLNTRFARAGARPFPPTAMVDLYWTARSKYKFSSNSLGAVADFFKIKTKKTHLDWDIWVAAQAGHSWAIRQVVKHNIPDVDITEQLWDRMKGQVFNHPRLGDKANCSSCGFPMAVDKHRVATHYKLPRIQLYCSRCRRYETRAA
jgi:uncharacterized protein YprB with RNaseH-like and TPR domain